MFAPAQVQPAADGRADALGAAGDQHGLSLHAALRSVVPSPVPIEFAVSVLLSTRPARCTPCPNPTPQRATTARAWSAAVHADIEAAGGWIPFERYMQQVLYAPGLGYYVAGARKFGAEGDFVTAPEMTPLFARALAVQVEPILAATRAREMVEFGAGSGVLAADLLVALAARDALPERYAILDVSPDLRERQRATIARRAPAHLALVEWLDALPSSIDGAVLMNEVLDAIPPHVVARRDGRWFERGVADGDGLHWADRPLSDAALQRTRRGLLPGGRRLRQRNQSRCRGAGRGRRTPTHRAARCSSSTTDSRTPSSTTRSAAKAR